MNEEDPPTTSDVTKEVIYDCVYGLFNDQGRSHKALATVHEKSEVECRNKISTKNGLFESSSNMIRLRATRSAHAQVELDQPIPVQSDLESCEGKPGFSVLSVTSSKWKKCFKVARVTLGLDGSENRCNLEDVDEIERDDLVVETVEEFEALRRKIVKR